MDNDQTQNLDWNARGLNDDEKREVIKAFFFLVFDRQKTVSLNKKTSILGVTVSRS